MASQHSNNWDKLKAPARPTQSVIDTYKQLIPNGPIFLLGVTPEIANSYDEVLAVDHDVNMIKKVWIGDTDKKIAFNSSWETFMPGKTFNGIIGDVALTLLADKKHITNFNKKAYDLLNTNGTVAQRIFHKPKDIVTKDNIIKVLNEPATINFNAFKWLMFMCYSEMTHSKIKLSNILKFFNEICPDRNKCSELTGWTIDSINTIDLYKDTDWQVIVMSKKEWLETIPAGASDVKFTYNDDYDLSELCPILSYSKHV